MPRSLLRWSIAFLIMCLLAPPSFAVEAKRRRASKPRFSPIPGGKLLRRDAAAAYEQMHAEARATGLWLWAVSGHRSWKEQRRLYRLYRKGLGPRAARPGRSNHQRGTAVDVSVGDESSAAYAWLAANACRFGFKRTVRSEPWHWEYRPRTTPAPEPGKDCLGLPRVPPELPTEVAKPSPS
jgi:D-alanyl-D-alanine carboxypeptidase